MFRLLAHCWVVLILAFCSVRPAQARESISVYLSFDKSTQSNPTTRWLVLFLQHRGFRLRASSIPREFKKRLFIVMRWSGTQFVRLNYKTLKQEVRLPARLQDPWLRARTVTSHVDFFLESVQEHTKGELQQRWIKAKKKLRSSSPSRVARQTSNKRVEQILNMAAPKKVKPRVVVRRPPRRRRVAIIKRRVVKRSPPKRRKRLVPVKVVRRVPPRKRLVALVRPPVPPVRRPAPRTEPKAKIIRVTVAPTIKRKIAPRRVGPAKPFRFFLDLGGTIGEPTTPGVLTGGEFGFGLSLWNWRISLLGRVQALVGNSTDDFQLLFIEPSLTLGLPSLSWHDRLFFTLDLGLAFDILFSSLEVEDDSVKEEWRFRLGGLVSGLFMATISDHWRFFLRLSFFISAQPYDIVQGTGSDSIVSIAPLRLSLQVGFRFYTP